MIRALLLLLWGCCLPASSVDDHGHDHGHGGGAHDHGHDEGGVGITRWSDTHELFVEIDPPVAGQPFAYAAHVTRIADNAPAEQGALTLRFDQDGFAAEAHTDDAVARTGIYAGSARAPATAGRYDLVFRWADGDESSEWTAQVEVGDGEPVEASSQQGEIAFLKESQWQVPFATAEAVEAPLVPTIRAPGVVRTAPDATALVAAPAEGLVAWTDGLPVPGRKVAKGERIAVLIPAGQAEHWASLQSGVSTARVERDLAERSLGRIEQLAQDGNVSERRLDEARAEVERAQADLQAAQRRVSAITTKASGAVPIRAPADGVIASVGAQHGEDVDAGHALVSVTTGPSVLIEGHVHSRDIRQLDPVEALFAMRGDWDEPRDLLAAGGALVTQQLVFDPRSLSAPVFARVDGPVGLFPGDLVELMIGVGEPTPRLVVPRSAVVEVNGQPEVFVQVSGESFSRRRVRLGVSDAHRVEILSGLQAGERVVVEGGFDVHVADLSGALESHRH